MDGARARLVELKKLMDKYAHEYYVLDEPTVSDAVYDGLMAELKQLESEYPELISSDSPSQRIGGKLADGFEKFNHSQRMMSLLDCFSDDEAWAWFERISKLSSRVATANFWVDSKKDGLACALHYDNGQLVRAVTRGDGTVGEDVTANVRTIQSVPLRLRGSGPLTIGRTEVRGEIIITKKAFEALNKTQENAGKPIFANPRNLAAGTIRQLDPRLVAARTMQFHGYDLIRDYLSDAPTVSSAFASMKDLGFIIDKEAHQENDLKSVLIYAKKFETNRHNLPYHTDGLVIKIDDRSLQVILGSVGKNPRGAIAYKYPAEQATTIVKDIVISIGRTGAATPVAVFDPVVVAGTTVQHASLHNADEIERKDIRVGDTVVIYKAGDIIPQVETVLKDLRPNGARRFQMESELSKQYPDMVFVRPEGEAVYRVQGSSGPLLLKKALEHYASRVALDIEGLGEKNVATLVDAGLVGDIADIYALNREQIVKLDRFAEVSADKLIKGIEAVKKPPLARFIFALGIRHVGAQTAIDLANTFKRLDSLGTASLGELKAVNGVGDVVADSLYLWFDEEENQALLAKFKKYGVWPEEAKHISSGPLTGKKFVITGTLEAMSREEAAEKLRALGGTFQSALGKDTDYLVVGGNVGASKLTKATKLDTEQLSEKEFLNFINK